VTVFHVTHKRSQELWKGPLCGHHTSRTQTWITDEHN